MLGASNAELTARAAVGSYESRLVPRRPLNDGLGLPFRSRILLPLLSSIFLHHGNECAFLLADAIENGFKGMPGDHDGPTTNSAEFVAGLAC